MTIDYHAALEAMAAVLSSDSRTSGYQQFVEQDPQIGVPDAGKCYALFLENRVPDPGQAIAAGKRTRLRLSFSVWSIGYDLGSFKEAAKKRDEVLAAVERVLMDNRTLNNTVTSLNLSGGRFSSARDDNGMNVFCSLAQTLVECEVSVINP